MNKVISKILWCLVLTILPGLVFCQDVITLKDGREVKAKIVEVSEKDKVIKYKKFENQDGPLYTVELSDISKVKYSNGSEESYNVAPVKSNTEPAAADDTPSIFSGKFNIEDESTHDYLEGIAKNAGMRVLRCAGRVDNYSTEIYWDQTYRDEVTKEIVLPIVVKWEKGASVSTKWVRGIVKIEKSGKKTWNYQSDAGISFSVCAKKTMEL
ncbi:MAG: hypothetical protein ABI772_13825 [Bacteroidota bacterium]